MEKLILEVAAKEGENFVENERIFFIDADASNEDMHIKEHIARREGTTFSVKPIEPHNRPTKIFVKKNGIVKIARSIPKKVRSERVQEISKAVLTPLEI